MTYAISSGESRRKYFWTVVDTLADCLLAPPISALVPDPDKKPNLKWSSNLANFKIDCANAAHAALPRPELRKAFWRLVYRRAMGLTSPDQTQDKLTNTTINRCAKTFIERKLNPSQYFGRSAA